jgi:O-antigen/teichoic acid export membrane protein
LVVQNLDADGHLTQSRSLALGLWALVLICLAVILLALYLDLDMGPLVFVIGAILVGAQFVLSGIANGLGQFLLARVNFVVLPNMLFLILLLIGVPQVTLLYCVALALGLGVSLVALHKIGWRAAQKRQSPSKNPAIFSLGALLTAILISSIAQLDLWLVALFGDGVQLALYAFASRMVVLLTFPVISYINILQPKLAGLVADQHDGHVQKLLRTDYVWVFRLVIMAAIIAPLFALSWGYIVFGALEWPLVWLSLSASLGYALSAYVPPFEALAYAKGVEGKYVWWVLGLVGAQVSVSLLLIEFGFIYGLPFVAGVTLGLVRFGMRGELAPLR